MNWALANATAKGNDYWQCSPDGSTYQHNTCPGPFNKGGVAEGHGNDGQLARIYLEIASNLDWQSFGS